MKTCTKCNVLQPLFNFTINRLTTDGHATRCKGCVLIFQQTDKRKKDLNRNLLKFRHNLSHYEKQILETQQNGCCDICDKSNNILCIDHDRTCCSGERSCSLCLRGLLCKDCDQGLGSFNNNINYLYKSITYLQKPLPFISSNVVISLKITPVSFFHKLSCEICGNNKNLMRDHNHNICDKKAHICNKCFRGILCIKCNLGIGSFKDNPQFILNAIEYLETYERHRTNNTNYIENTTIPTNLVTL